MRKITPYSGDILIPMQVVELNFMEKEDAVLNPFQRFVLEAIEERYSVDEIAQATLLTTHAIRVELSQLIAQKFVREQDGMLELTDLSKRLLLVSRCVRCLNEEKKKVCVNLMNGEFQEYDGDRFIGYDERFGLELRTRIRRQEIDGLGMEENMELFKRYLAVDDSLDDETLEAVLSLVYVELNDTGERVFDLKSVSYLPCLIGSETESAVGEAFTAQGQLCRICFVVKTVLEGVEDEVLAYLPMLAHYGLLSEKGVQLAQEVDRWQNKEIIMYYDYVSGAWRLDRSDDNGKCCDEERHGRRHKIDLELPILCELTEAVERDILEYVRRELELPNVFDAKIKDKTDETYITSGILWGRDDA